VIRAFVQERQVNPVPPHLLSYNAPSCILQCLSTLGIALLVCPSVHGYDYLSYLALPHALILSDLISDSVPVLSLLPGDEAMELSQSSVSLGSQSLGECSGLAAIAYLERERHTL
jgi:hypothetical protein